MMSKSESDRGISLSWVFLKVSLTDCGLAQIYNNVFFSIIVDLSYTHTHVKEERRVGKKRKLTVGPC